MVEPMWWLPTSGAPADVSSRQSMGRFKYSQSSVGAATARIAPWIGACASATCRTHCRINLATLAGGSPSMASQTLALVSFGTRQPIYAGNALPILADDPQPGPCTG